MLNRTEEVKKKYLRKFPHLDELNGKIWVKGTSFTAESEDVVNYLQSLRRQEPRAPYEFIQNCLDYNHDACGTPEVWIYTTDEIRYSFADFIRLDPEAQSAVTKTCSSIEFNNYLTEGQGLSPQNLIHRAHKGPQGTEGKHGIGSKIAGTALVAGEHASSIEYFSKYHDTEKGKDIRWHGEAIMSIDQEGFAVQTDPDFTVAYQLDEGVEKTDEREQTKVIIHDPSEVLVQSLTKLPEYLLQTNSHYWNYRLNHTKELHPTDNDLTVFLNREDTGSLAGKDNVTSLSIAQSNNINIPKIPTKEKPRIEILSRELLGDKDDSAKDYVYVDGLKLYSGGSRFKFNWSFFGFKDADSRYRVERSSESGFLVGDPSRLITASLGKCTNEKIFEELIDASINSGERLFELSNIDSQVLVEEIRSNKQAQEAVVKAWENYCDKNKLNSKGSTYITDNATSFNKGNEEGYKSLFFKQPVFFKVLTELGVTKRLESSVRLSQRDTKNGDEIKIYSYRDTYGKSYNEYLKATLLDEVFANGGSMKVKGKNILIDFPYTTDFKDYESALGAARIDGFGPILRSLERFWENFGVTVSINVAIGGSGGKAFQINYSTEDKYDSKEFTIEPIIREIEKDQKELSIEISINSEKGTGQLDFLKFARSLSGDLRKITDPEGRIDRGKYMESVKRDEYRLYKTLELEKRRADKEIMRKEKEGQRRLRLLEEQALDLKRWMGSASKDRSSNSPTRRTLRAPNKNGELPPDDFERTHTSLMMPSVLTTSTCRTDSDVRSQNSPTQILERIETTEQARRFVERHLQALQSPDIQLLNGQLLTSGFARATLLNTINERDSDSNVFDTAIKLPSSQQNDQLGCRINRSLFKGDYAVPIVPNAKIIGFYHPDKSVANQIAFTQSSKTKIIEFSTSNEITPGLEIYYEYDANNSYNWTPTDKEKEIDSQIINHLNSPWKNLISAVKSSNFSSKQKLDIALTAWVHSFKYNDSPEIDDLFKGLKKDKRQAKIINKATGNCGYASEGFVAVCRLLDLPAIEYLAYLGEHDRFYPGNDNHGVDGVFIGNEWVIVDPQGQYLTPGYELGDIPKEYVNLINQIPKGINAFPRVEKNTAPVGADAILKRLTTSSIGLDEETIKMIRQLQDIERSDLEIDREYSNNLSTRGRMRRGGALGSGSGSELMASIFGAAGNNDFEMDDILKQFNIVDDPINGLNRLIMTNNSKTPIFTLSDKLAAADFLAELRSRLIQKYSYKVDDKATPDVLLRMMEQGIVEGILETAYDSGPHDIDLNRIDIRYAANTEAAVSALVKGIRTSERRRIINELKVKGLWSKMDGGEGSAEGLVKILVYQLISNHNKFDVSYGAHDMALALLRKFSEFSSKSRFLHELSGGERAKLGTALVLEIVKSILSGKSSNYNDKLEMEEILLTLKKYETN